MEYIKSRNNPIIKKVKQLNNKKYRDADQMYYIEGIKFILEAFNNNVDIVYILMSDEFTKEHLSSRIFEEVKVCGAKKYILPNNLFSDISDTTAPQGIMAVLKSKRIDLQDILIQNNFLLILDSIQDPGNLGTIIRTADAANATGLILSKGCVDVYNPKVLRSTMGSIFHIPIFLTENIIETVRFLKQKQINVYASQLNAENNYFDVDFKKNMALIIGNESNGVQKELLFEADELIKIPMPGRSESINASVACAILTFEVVRQRFNKGS